MLLASRAVPRGDARGVELKWGGCRERLRYDGHSVTLRTRIGRECSADFHGLADIAGVLGRQRVTLRGEFVCLRPCGHLGLRSSPPATS